MHSVIALLQRIGVGSKLSVPDATENDGETGLVARTALALTAWSERWIPDAFVFALIATVLVVVAGVGLTERHTGRRSWMRGAGASGT